MYLMRMIGREGQYQSDLPDFMVFLDWKAYPWYWSFTDHFWYAAALVVLVPALLAFAFGFFAFRSRIRGVYFSIITQALTFAFMLLFFRNDTGFGGNNGFTDFKRILGYRIAEPATRATLFAITGLYLAGVLVLCQALVRSKFGRVLTAIRDSEMRVMFCGYNPLWYKLFAWVLSAVLCGVAGALYVPQVGIINPSEMSPANSIEIAIWTAVGGRGTIIGPFVGTFLVKGAEFFLSGVLAEFWQLVMGGLFIFVVLVLRDGIVGTIANWWRKRERGSIRQITEESDRRAHDRQHDWEPEGAPTRSTEI
jgi:urea transport system permease protein